MSCSTLVVTSCSFYVVGRSALISMQKYKLILTKEKEKKNITTLVENDTICKVDKT